MRHRQNYMGFGFVGLCTGSKIFSRVHLHRQEEIYFKIRQVAFNTNYLVFKYRLSRWKKSICPSSEISSISFLLAQWLPESHFRDTFKSNHLCLELDHGILKDFIKVTITLVWHCLHPFPWCFPLHLTNFLCLFKLVAIRIAFYSEIWDHIRKNKLLVWGLMQPHQFSSSLSQKWEEEMLRALPWRVGLWALF